MWLVLVGAAFGADADATLVREPPPFGTPSRIPWIVRYTDGATLDTPTFLQVTDAPPDLRESFRKSQNGQMAAGSTFAALGVVIAMTGLIASGVVAYNSYDPDTGSAEFYGIAIGSAVVGTAVAAIAIGPLTTHSRHRRDPSMVMDETTADLLIARHNEGLTDSP